MLTITEFFLMKRSIVVVQPIQVNTIQGPEHWWIQREGGALVILVPPLGPISSIFMHFFENFGQNNKFPPQLLMLVPSLGNSGSSNTKFHFSEVTL